VQQAVVQGLGSARARSGVEQEQAQAQPGEQVDADGRGGAPGLVDGEFLGGQVAQAGVFAGADAVLDAGVGAVTGLQPLRPAGGGVGGDQLVAPAVVVLEQRQLRPRSWVSPAGR
jgi:hypothetical protein